MGKERKKTVDEIARQFQNSMTGMGLGVSISVPGRETVVVSVACMEPGCKRSFATQAELDEHTADAHA